MKKKKHAFDINKHKAQLAEKEEFLELSVKLLAQYKEIIKEQEAELKKLKEKIVELQNAQTISK